MLRAICALSPTQLAILIVVIAVAVLILVGNIVLGYLRHKNSVRTLCTQQLQLKRNELLARLEEIKGRGNIAVGEESEDEGTADTEAEEDAEDDGEGFGVPAVSEAPADADCEILAVKDMSSEIRSEYGLDSEEFADKRYYVRYVPGFYAKLRAAEPAVQKRYADFANEVGQYMGVKIRNAFSQQRICKGQNTIGLILFTGKALCVAFALDPANYADTKYRGIDKSESERFAATPMLIKLTSEKKLEYAKYLLVQLADANTILLSETPVEKEFDFTAKSNDELLAMNELRIRFMGEVPDSKNAAETQ